MQGVAHGLFADSIADSQLSPSLPRGSDVVQPQAYNLMQPSWSSFNDLQLSASLTPEDAPSQQPWHAAPDSSQSMIQSSWSSSNDLQPSAEPNFVCSTRQSSSTKLNNFPHNAHESTDLNYPRPQYLQLSTDLSTGNNMTRAPQSEFVWTEPPRSHLNDLDDASHY